MKGDLIFTAAGRCAYLKAAAGKGPADGRYV